MNPPFTTAQFLDVVNQYNGATWPAQIVLYVLAGLTIYWAARSSPRYDRRASAALAFLWAWMGVVYHWLFFTSINPAAGVLGTTLILSKNRRLAEADTPYMASGPGGSGSALRVR